MTKTCPDCKAEVLSTSNRVEPVVWRWRHVNSPSKNWNYQHEPIGNHNEYLEVEPLYTALAATPAVGGEASERLDVIAGRLMGEAFCADWHDDPDMGVRECMRIKAFFIERINEFVCDEIKRAAQPASPLRGREILKHCDELHDLGFNAGWNGAIEESAKLIESGAGMADLIDQDELDQQAKYIRALSASPPEQPAADSATMRETCIECGKCDPCDDDCPNYIEPAAATKITDEMVLAGAKAANPFAWEMDEHDEYLLDYSARQAMLDEIRQILTAALSPAAAPVTGRDDVIAECAAIADRYDDCGGAFIAQKIRDLYTSSTAPNKDSQA